MQMIDSSIKRSTLKLKMRLNINLHDGTLDEALLAWKCTIVSRQRFIFHSCQAAWAEITSALASEKGIDFEMADKRQAKEERLFSNMFEQLQRQESEWFNDDANYKAALNDAIDFRKDSIPRIVMTVIDHKRRQADRAGGRAPPPRRRGITGRN
jgi:hypothetical protein